MIETIIGANTLKMAGNQPLSYTHVRLTNVLGKVLQRISNCVLLLYLRGKRSPINTTTRLTALKVIPHEHALPYGYRKHALHEGMLSLALFIEFEQALAG